MFGVLVWFLSLAGNNYVNINFILRIRRLNTLAVRLALCKETTAGAVAFVTRMIVLNVAVSVRIETTIHVAQSVTEFTRYCITAAACTRNALVCAWLAVGLADAIYIAMPVDTFPRDDIAATILTTIARFESSQITYRTIALDADTVVQDAVSVSVALTRLALIHAGISFNLSNTVYVAEPRNAVAIQTSPGITRIKMIHARFVTLPARNTRRRVASDR